jgi:hypothetical protein
MAKLRRHRKEKHPKAHRESVKKMLRTKGIYDPLKVRKGLINKPKVRGYKDFHGSGLIRVLFRQKDLFPEFTLYLKKQFPTQSLVDAGLKPEAKGKWVLRTTRFNIFVYI